MRPPLASPLTMHRAGARAVAFLVTAMVLLGGCGTTSRPAVVVQPQPSVGGPSSTDEQTQPPAPRTRSAVASSPEHCTTRTWPYPTKVLDMQFVGSAGWAVGAAGILATTDSGAHWGVQLRTRQPDLGGVDFVDSDHGWVVGTSRLLATLDGGTHWHKLPEPHCRAIRMVHFVSPNLGFAVAGGSTRGAPGGLPSAGGVLLSTSDGGRSWKSLPGPPDAQSVCFQDPRVGWVGTRHGIYASTDGGQRWRRIVATPGGRRGAHPIVDIRCSGQGTAWALAIGPGAASNQMPQLGWWLTTVSAKPLFAEQYFAHPAVRVSRESPGSYPGPFSPIDPATAAFFGNCPACGTGAGSVLWVLADTTGQPQRRGNLAGLSNVTAAAFTNTDTGCAAGEHRGLRHHTTTARIVCTIDSGSHWQVTWRRSLPRS